MRMAAGATKLAAWVTDAHDPKAYRFNPGFGGSSDRNKRSPPGYARVRDPPRSKEMQVDAPVGRIRPVTPRMDILSDRPNRAAHAPPRCARNCRRLEF